METEYIAVKVKKKNEENWWNSVYRRPDEKIKKLTAQDKPDFKTYHMKRRGRNKV